MFRSFLSALGGLLPPSENWLATWWERVLALVAIGLVLAFVASFIEDC